MDFFLTFGDFHRQLPLKYSTARLSLVSHSSVQQSRRGADMQLILVPRYIYGPSQSEIPDVIYHPSIHSFTSSSSTQNSFHPPFHPKQGYSSRITLSDSS